MEWFPKWAPEFIDQALHFLWAFAAIGVVAWFGPNYWSGALAGFIIAAPREFVDQWHGWPSGIGKIRDVVFFTLGGAIAGGFLPW